MEELLQCPQHAANVGLLTPRLGQDRADQAIQQGGEEGCDGQTVNSAARAQCQPPRNKQRAKLRGMESIGSNSLQVRPTKEEEGSTKALMGRGAWLPMAPV